jgi:CDGSH-type Zn-finger protein/uncharacterized Fe-S cluster protein YjdI
MNAALPFEATTREHLLHLLYEAAELEHNLMCTYLYAAWSLREGAGEGLVGEEIEAVARWRGEILSIAIEEMGHLVAVWNITAALGGAPRFGRSNFPLDMGYLPADIVVKLAPFDAETLQHFVFLERPAGSTEPEGDGFVPERRFTRGNPAARLTPMGLDYPTVGVFYARLQEQLTQFVASRGEPDVFVGDPALQIAGAGLGLSQAPVVRCLKTALQALDAIVAQGEGAADESTDSHYCRFVRVRDEYRRLAAARPDFRPAHPAATNPVLRRPPRPEGRVWIETPEATEVVDLANAAYGLMLRALGALYRIPAGEPRRTAVLDLGIGLMRAVTALGETAARLPAGPANPGCNAGLSFIALRDASALPPGAASDIYFVERSAEIAQAAQRLPPVACGGRTERAAALLVALAERTRSALGGAFAPAMGAAAPAPVASAAAPGAVPRAGTLATVPAPSTEVVAGRDVEIAFTAARCIHARFCVTGAPKVFLANVQGPWIHPDEMPAERLVEIAHACPSGAIQYRRLDGAPEEAAPPVNLATIREAGPYAFRAPLQLAGKPAGFRATLCRCGASKQKPYCDGSHKEAGFTASGEPPTGTADMLPVRDGALAVDPQPDGPLAVAGNLEIVTGTGRIVARVTQARLCRCGASGSKPFCDGTHARIGFRAP